ncbi:hypothetical protein [Caballeronia grimmiae]|uniref:hypothetical protein n=1 Tax=Caballeronia grimmiae TaxID=1071679 RepID=UPI0038BC88E6
MQASASALLQVVNDVLDFSKMDIGEMRLAEEWGSIRDLVVRVMIARAPLANEYREWFENLYDRDGSALTLLSQPGAVSTDGCDYLIATDEFSDKEIQAAWEDTARLVRMTQNGPLVLVQ